MNRHVCRWAASIVLFALAVPLALASDPAARTFRIRVTGVVDWAATVRELRGAGYDVPYVDPKRGVLDVVGTEADRLALVARGFMATEILEQNGPGTDALSDYLSPAEVEARLGQLQTAHPARAQRIAYATDHEGRTAWALKISDQVTQDEDEPVILFVAQHHAREVMTPEVVIDIAEQLLGQYGIDPVLTRWVDSYEIWLIPSHNPDGTAYVFASDSNWRKNRRNNGGSFGVDPNRNYPWQWGNTVCSGSSSSAGSDTYHGPSAGSEPTTQGLMNLAIAQRPAVAISYHTYSELAIHPYGCTDEFPANPDLRFIREMANEVSTRMLGDVAGTWYKFGSAPELLYEVDGEMSDWFYGRLGAVGVTFELNTSGQGFQPDYATWRDSTVNRARAGWRYFFELFDRSRLTGHVTNACTASPVAATVGLAELTFLHNEVPRTAEPLFGRYEWFTMPGTVTLQVDQAGYRAQSWPTTVGYTPVSREVRLVPIGSFGVRYSALTPTDPGGDGDGIADPGETIGLTLEAYVTGEAVTGLTATVTSSDPYVTVLAPTASFGAVAAGTRASAGGVQLAISPAAPDQHVVELTVSFNATQTLCSPVDQAQLHISRGFPSCPAVEERLDTNPNWAIDNGATAGGWAFGPPASSGVGGPSAASTGSNVYGTNLSGTYTDNSDYRLVAGPYDLSALRGTELRFARWLVSEAGFDIARVQLRVGAAGTWTTVWEGFGRDSQWVPVRYDVSALADLEDEVYVRFQLTSDTGTNQAGFYLDDLSFCGEEVPGVGGKVKYKAHTIDDSNLAYANGNGAWDVGETATLTVDVTNSTSSLAQLISAVLTAETPGVTVFDATASYPDIPTGGQATSLAPHFTIRASSGCGSSANFRLTTRWNDGQRADSVFSVPLGQTGETSALFDSMETNQGWTPGGNARPAGQFTRANPNGVTDAVAGPVQPEDDTSPAPGESAWVTGNPPVGSGFDPRSGDVDAGSAWIDSPLFDGRGGDSLLLRFARWFHRSGVTGLNDGSYRARLSNDGGANWTDLETLATNASAWSTRDIDITSTLPRTANMRLRFEAIETLRTPGDPLIELLIDDVAVRRREIVCAPFTPAETKAPNPVAGTLAVARAGGDVVLSWSAPAVDATHDAARFYPVYRSAAPTSGFAPSGETTAPSWHDVDGAVASLGSRYYLVVARNAAGTSGEEPTP